MKRNFVFFFVLLLLAGLAAPAAFAQATGSVKGVCKDREGNPIVGATVEFLSSETGHKYTLKTDKKGEYFSLGISPGKYTVTLRKDGAEVYHFNNFPVELDESKLDFDMKKEQASAAQGQGLSAEQVKQVQETQAKASKDKEVVKALNEHLQTAAQQMQAGTFDLAVATLQEAVTIDPNRDLLYFKLGDAYRMSAPKQTDPAEKQKRYDSSVTAYQKAIELRKALAADPLNKEAAESPQKLAAYYNNLAEVLNKAGKVDESVKTYHQAAEADPPHAGQYLFNAGAVLTNAGRVDDALAAFDAVIAADPKKADAYYWKGVNLIGKAVTKGDKMVAPPGTSEAFNKYLELDPTGQFAQPAKDMLATIGAAVETSFGKPKKPSGKK